MRTLAVTVTLLWFALVALLWMARPHELVWLGGSLVLGAIYFTGFFWYVTRRR
jgi:hypothetical protein